MTTLAEHLISLSQAAELLGVSRQTIYALIGRGDLDPVKVSERQYLVRAAVEVLKRRRADGA